MAAKEIFDKKRAGGALLHAIIAQTGIRIDSTGQLYKLEGLLQAALYAAYQKGVLDASGS